MLCELPARYTLPVRCDLHVVNALLIFVVTQFFGTFKRDQPFWKGILIDVVLVVQLGHGEAGGLLMRLSNHSHQ